jgi:hypothetical protein
VDYFGTDNMVFYRSYLEAQFVEGMTWENYGTVWHIDHRIPLKYNNPTDDEMFDRLHFTNTQPMFATENMAKGNRYIM